MLQLWTVYGAIDDSVPTFPAKENMCADNPCGITNTSHFVCSNGFGTYSCSCASGWAGDNCDLSESDPCAINPCLNGGTCASAPTPSGYNCTCPTDYSGKKCQYYNYCKNTTCSGTCTSEFGGASWKCTCPPGYQGWDCKTRNYIFNSGPVEDGCYNWNDALKPNCKEYVDNWLTIDKCRYAQEWVINPFYERFVVSEKKCYTCNDTSALGTYDPNQCESNTTEPCGESEGRGICVNKIGSYSCRCHPLFTGTDCESPIPDPCLISPCENNATCITDTETYAYECKCKKGFHGPNCEYSQQCTKSVCQNMGTCYERDNGTGCHCLQYYHGEYCEIVDRCEYGNPCGPHGTCESNATDISPIEFKCVCQDGYLGSLCDIETNECVPDPCQNGGTCVDGFLSYTCLCLEGSTGYNCEIDVPDCVPIQIDGQWYPNKCMTKDPDAVCVDMIGGFECQCGSQYVGEFCNLHIIIRDVLMAIYGEVNLQMIPLLEDLLKNPAQIKDMVPFITGLIEYDDRIPLSWTPEDMFEWVSFEDKLLDPAVHLNQWNDVVLGNCFTLNHKLNMNNTFVYRNFGTDSGLRAKVKLNQREYVPWIDIAAILVFVHHMNDYIFAESVRYNAQPRGEFVIDIRDTRYTKLGGRYGQCIKDPNEVEFFYYDKSFGYATEGCLRSCYQNMINSSCGCIDPRYPGPVGTSVCLLAERSCVETAIKEAGDPSTWKTCVCPLPCNSQQLTVTWSRSEFVSSPAECEGAADPSKCRKDFDDATLVSIRLPKAEFSLYAETPAMTFNKFVSNLGGLLGVLMGVQIISFIEVIFLIWRLVVILISNKNM